jgi:hypothetical protein
MSVHVAALQRAAEILGGREALAQYLDVPLEFLELWLDGHTAPPAHVFLLAIDVVVEHGVAEMRNGPLARPPSPPTSLH